MEEERKINDAVDYAGPLFLEKDILTVQQWICILETFPDDYEVFGWRNVLISEHFDRKEDDGL